MRKMYDKKIKLHRNILFLIIFLVLLLNLSQIIPIGHILYILTPDVDKKVQYSDNYHRQTEAFLHGQAHFFDDASNLSKLVDLYYLKEREGVSYLFDTSYYKGKYYSYFSALPVFFFLLPIYLITHQYLNLVVLNLFIITIAFFMASLVYRKIVEDYIKEVPLSLYGY